MIASGRAIAALMIAVGAVVGGAAEPVETPLRLPPHPLGPLVILADGGMVAGTIVSIGDTSVVVQSATLGRLELPRAAVRGYRSSTALGPDSPRQFDAAAGERAALRLMNGDQVVAASVTLGDGVVRIRTTDETAHSVAIPLALVRAIDFAEPGVMPPSRRTLIALDDGSRYSAASMPRECDPSDMVATFVEDDSLRLLQGLEPVECEQGPAHGGAVTLAVGRTLAGAWPAARGTTAFTGLGIHAPARVRYRLDAPADRFESLVAIDDSAGQGGSVIVRVLAGSDAGEPRELYASPIIRGGEEPLAIGVDLGGATEVELVVDPTPDGVTLDRTIWLDPRIVFEMPRHSR